jgi:hypothetical protein
MPSVIDKLPEADRKKVIDALLAQKPLRDIAKAAGCSHTAVQNYRDRVLRPALETARKVNAITAVANSPIDAESNAQQLTRARLATDPFVERVEYLNSERARIKGTAEASGDLKAWAALDRNDITALELHARSSAARWRRPHGHDHHCIHHAARRERWRRPSPGRSRDRYNRG